jgi:hypothetical protein
VGEPGISGVSDCLLLHGGIHHDPREISGLDRPSPARDRQALLQQRRKLFFAQALTPAGQRRAVKRQLLPEHRFATEILEIRILYPSVAQIVHVLEDEKPRHQSRWQWRLFRPYATNRTETLGQKIPINLRGEPHQRMTKVDDRLQDERNSRPGDGRAAGSSFLPNRESHVKGITNRPKQESQNPRKRQQTSGFLAKSTTCSA